MLLSMVFNNRVHYVEIRWVCTMTSYSRCNIGLQLVTQEQSVRSLYPPMMSMETPCAAKFLLLHLELGRALVAVAGKLRHLERTEARARVSAVAFAYVTIDRVVTSSLVATTRGGLQLSIV